MLKGLLEKFFVYNEHRYEVVQKCESTSMIANIF